MIRPRPEAAIARDARTSFLRAVRELRLEFAGTEATTYRRSWSYVGAIA